jgi:flagellar capping protein FliD
VTDLQLYLAIGIPTLAVFIGILMNVVQINTVNGRISNLENRVDTRISTLEARVDARFNNLEVKFDTLIGKVIDLDNRVTRIEAKLNLG